MAKRKVIKCLIMPLCPGLYKGGANNEDAVKARTISITAIKFSAEQPSQIHLRSVWPISSNKTHKSP